MSFLKLVRAENLRNAVQNQQSQQNEPKPTQIPGKEQPKDDKQKALAI